MFLKASKESSAMFTRLLPLLVLAGCALRDPSDSQGIDSDSGSSSTGESAGSGAPVDTSGGGPTTVSTTAPADPTTGGLPSTGEPDPTVTASGDDTTVGFIVPPDHGGGPGCDTWSEDCPEGQKCMPFANDGGFAWNDLKCVPIVPDPDQFGEPCQAIGSGVSGEDTCDKHLMCWDVDQDTLAGTCTAMCIGSPESPDCEHPGTSCVLTGDGVLTLCIAECDPIAQDCPGDDLCIPNPASVDSFLCVLDASGEEGQAFDPCEYANACDKGLYCLNPELANECDPTFIGCCLPFCELNAPNNCPGQGLECVAWFEEGQAPPGLENLGVCALPQP